MWVRTETGCHRQAGPKFGNSFLAPDIGLCKVHSPQYPKLAHAASETRIPSSRGTFTRDRKAVNANTHSFETHTWAPLEPSKRARSLSGVKSGRMAPCTTHRSMLPQTAEIHRFSAHRHFPLENKPAYGWTTEKLHGKYTKSPFSLATWLRTLCGILFSSRAKKLFPVRAISARRRHNTRVPT